MPEIVRVIKELGIIEVQSFGDVSVEDIASSVEFVKQIFKKAGINKVLVNTTKQESMPSTMNIFDFFSSNLPIDTKIAVLFTEKQPTESDIRFGEAVASNRGFSIQIFTSRDKALKWLKG